MESESGNFETLRKIVPGQGKSEVIKRTTISKIAKIKYLLSILAKLKNNN